MHFLHALCDIHGQFGTRRTGGFSRNAIKLRNLSVARRSGLPVLKGLAVLVNPLEFVGGAKVRTASPLRTGSPSQSLNLNGIAAKASSPLFIIHLIQQDY
jgi:hypothetical protein